MVNRKGKSRTWQYGGLEQRVARLKVIATWGKEGWWGFVGEAEDTTENLSNDQFSGEFIKRLTCS